MSQTNVDIRTMIETFVQCMNIESLSDILEPQSKNCLLSGCGVILNGKNERRYKFCNGKSQ
jgi:hypothetical protein